VVAKRQTLEVSRLPILKHRTAQGEVGSTLRNTGSNPVHGLGQAVALCAYGVVDTIRGGSSKNPRLAYVEFMNRQKALEQTAFRERCSSVGGELHRTSCPYL